jgi:penicillin-binding protein 2
MFTLLVGLWYVQVISVKHHVKNQQTQTIRTVRVPASRGKILDRNGVPLADNRPHYNINLYLEELRPLFQAEYRRQKGKRKLSRSEIETLGRQARYSVASNAVSQLGELYGLSLRLDPTQFARFYEQKLALPLPLLTNLVPTQAALFLERSTNAPGLDLEIQPSRVYPQGSAAGHLLGYLRRSDAEGVEEPVVFNYRMPDFKGVIGLEATFDTQLRGHAGVKTLVVNSLGYRQSENVWDPPDPGRNLILTLDVQVQQAAERALRWAGANVCGAIVVMDVKNGDVLASVSSPGLDPNLFVPRISSEEWARLNDPVLRPLINRATHGTFTPGSIFKIVVGLACLEAGVLDPAETYHSAGFYPIGGRSIRDLAPEGDYNFRRAFKLSSNTYFIHYGLKAGFKRIVDLGERLHLGEISGLPTGQDAAGIFPTPAHLQRLRELRRPWNDGNTAHLSIGQEIAVTPVQMAVMMAAVANGGKVYWPRLVQRIEPQEAGSDTTDVTEFPPRLRGELGVSPRSLEIVREAMLADVEDPDGTGRASALPGLRICGKTGTAQTKHFEHGEVVPGKDTWFASFAPYENPRWAVVVLVVNGLSGGATCAPIARVVYQTLHRREQAGASMSTLVNQN